MVEFLGWIGFTLFISTLLPFAARRLHLRQTGAKFFARHHHSLAVFCLVTLSLHGFVALIVKRGWQWGKLGNFMTGTAAWLVMVTVVVLALTAIKQKPFPRTHCWLVVLLVVLILSHTF